MLTGWSKKRHLLYVRTDITYGTSPIIDYIAQNGTKTFLNSYLRYVLCIGVQILEIHGFELVPKTLELEVCGFLYLENFELYMWILRGFLGFYQPYDAQFSRYTVTA
jgi:hypothetical protein